MSAYTDFASDPNARHVWLFEVNGRNIAADTLATYYFSSFRYGTDASDTLVNKRYDARILAGFEVNGELQGAIGPLNGLLPGKTGGTIRLGQMFGDLDLGTLAQLGGVPLHEITFAGRNATVRHGGYSPKLGRWLTYAEFQPFFLSVDGEPHIGVDDVTFTLASKERNFEYPAQKRTFWGLGYGILFDGTDDAIDFTTDATFNFTSGAFTVEFPLYVEANPGAEKTIVSRGSVSTDGWSIVLGTGGKIGFRTNQSGAAQFTESTAITLKQHVWVSIARSGAAASIYFDGVLANETSATHVDPATATRNLYLGRNNGGTQYLNAIISEFRIWNVARNKELVNAFMHRPLTSTEVSGSSALKLYARLNEGTGTAAADSTATGADGTIAGTAVWVHSGTGHAGLVGQKLPDLWGPVRGWTPQLIDSVRQIYFVSSHPIESLLRADVGGVENMVVDAATTSLFTFLTTTPAAGHCRLCTVTGGTWFRLGTEPSKKLTIDVEGNAPGGTYLENAADQIRYIVCNRGLTPLTDPTDLNTTSFTDLETANAAAIGHGWYEDVSVAEMIGLPLRSVGALAWFETDTGLFAVKRNEGVAGETAILDLSGKDIAEGTFQPLQRGTPTASVTVLFQRNYTPLSPTDYLTGLAGTEREHFASKDWQTAGQTDWAAKVDFKNAKTLELETGYDTTEDAQTEASRLLALYNASDQAVQFLCKHRGLQLDKLDTVNFHLQDLSRTGNRQSRFGTSSTAKFLVLDTRPDTQRAGLWLLLWREEIT